MAGKGRIYRLIVLVIAAFAAVGCSSPMGNIGNGLSSSNVYGGLVVEPQIVAYTQNDRFRKDTSNLLVFIIDRGQRRSVPLEDCEVWIIEGNVTTLVTATGYPLTTIGIKIVQVNYRSFTYQYYIQVVEPATGSSQTGIQVRWDP
jgi:hypothetical protein